MAISTQQLLAQLSPVQQLSFGGGGSGSMERERLKLAKAQFEEEKRQHEERMEMQRLQEQGEAARAALAQQRAEAKAEEDRQAALLTRQQDAMLKAGELAGAGKTQQLHAMGPAFDQLGYDMNSLGSVAGLPVYEFQNRAQQAARAEQEFQRPRSIEGWDEGESANQSLRRMEGEGLGYPTDERGVLDQPAGLSSTQGAYEQALAASQHARETGTPLRGPDEEDYMGAVPRNRIDMPAMQAETLARLNPVFAARVAGLPEELQPMAAENAKAIGGLGLEAPDAISQMDKALEDPIALYKDRKTAERAAAPKDLTEMDHSTLRTRGEGAAYESATKEYKVPDAIEARRQGLLVMRMLDTGDERIHQFLGPAVMSVAGVVGTQSNLDLAETLGASRQTFLDQGVDWFRQRFIEGGFSPEQMQALRTYLDAGIDQATGQAFDFMDAADKRIRDGSESEDERTGWRNYLLRMPQDLREEYDLYRHDRGDEEEAAADRQPTAGRDVATGGGDFDVELEAQALENDLDPEKLRPVIGHESGGRADARNPKSGATGIIQFMPSVAKQLGTSTEALAKMTPAEQLPYAVKYLQGWGITSDSRPEDYALAVAAPAFIGKSDDTVVYAKGSRAHKDNVPWQPADGGDITVGDILRFYGLRGGEAEKETGEPEPPRTKVEQQILDILR